MTRDTVRAGGEGEREEEREKAASRKLIAKEREQHQKKRIALKRTK